MGRIIEKLEQQYKVKQEIILELKQEKNGLFKRLDELYKIHFDKDIDYYKDIEACRMRITEIHNSLAEIGKEQDRIIRKIRILKFFKI